MPLAPRVGRAVDLAIAERLDGPIFIEPGGQRLDRRAAGRIVRRIGRRAGIGKPVGPHTLRHAFITASVWCGCRCAMGKRQLAMRTCERRCAMAVAAILGPPRHRHRRHLHRRRRTLTPTDVRCRRDGRHRTPHEGLEGRFEVFPRLGRWR